ncbi:hypothetical protein AB4K20DRAFT_1963507 [Rhizopus microsporus]
MDNSRLPQAGQGPQNSSLPPLRCARPTEPFGSKYHLPWVRAEVEIASMSPTERQAICIPKPS